MAWEPFERAASGYAEWYATRRGRRVDQAECDLLAWLLESFPSATSALEIGCGTGQFSHRLRDRLGQVIGVVPSDRAGIRHGHHHYHVARGRGEFESFT